MSEPKIREQTLRPVDDEARALARRLVRASGHASLAAIEPGTGFPLASRVSVATDFEGRPILLVSDLSVHTAALRADPRCSLLLGEPGGGDPLRHPRVTVIGRARLLARGAPERASARTRFLARHPAAELYADFGDFHFAVVEPERAGLNGGFARAFELAAADFVDPDGSSLAERAERARLHMNEDHAEAVDAIAARLAPDAGTGWSIVTADRRGFEIARGDRLERIEFARPVEEPEGYRAAFVALVQGD
jgi:heme iron utilization protein